MQNENSVVVSLLQEIRDIQREHLDAYRAQAKRAIELQEITVARQRQQTRVYYVSLIVLVIAAAWSVYEFVF